MQVATIQMQTERQRQNRSVRPIKNDLVLRFRSFDTTTFLRTLVENGREVIEMTKKGPLAKYVVRLSGDERWCLEGTIRTGRDAAYRLLKARIMLRADVSPEGGGWDDRLIAAALDTSASTGTYTSTSPTTEHFSLSAVPMIRC